MLQEYLKEVSTESDWVLDIGSKNGEKMNNISAKTISIDIMFNSTDFDTEYVLADGMRLPFNNQIFDYVFCSQVFEHIPNTRILVEEVSRVLKTGGKALISFPNRLGPQSPHTPTPWWSSYLPRPVGNRLLPFVLDEDEFQYYKQKEFMLTPLKARYYLEKHFAEVNYVVFRFRSKYREERLSDMTEKQRQKPIRKLLYGSSPYLAQVEQKPIIGGIIELFYPAVSYIAVK